MTISGNPITGSDPIERIQINLKMVNSRYIASRTGGLAYVVPIWWGTMTGTSPKKCQICSNQATDVLSRTCHAMVLHDFAHQGAHGLTQRRLCPVV